MRPWPDGLAGAGTGVLTALGAAIGSAGAPVVFNGAGGTPSSLTLTNALGLSAAAMPALTGDVTTSAGAVATTLATVNATVGTFGGATQAASLTNIYNYQVGANTVGAQGSIGTSGTPGTIVGSLPSSIALLAGWQIRTRIAASTTSVGKLSTEEGNTKVSGDMGVPFAKTPSVKLRFPVVPSEVSKCR